MSAVSKRVGLAVVSAAALLAAGAAQAHEYGAPAYYPPQPVYQGYGHQGPGYYPDDRYDDRRYDNGYDYAYRAPRERIVPYGPADPCARQAGNRRLGWGIVGLLAGGLAGGAAAGAGVVAEGAGLGGVLGAIVGGKEGERSAACGTAGAAARAGNYPPYGLEPSDPRYPRDQAGGYGYDYGYGQGYAPAPQPAYEPYPNPYPGSRHPSTFYDYSYSYSRTTTGPVYSAQPYYPQPSYPAHPCRC